MKLGYVEFRKLAIGELFAINPSSLGSPSADLVLRKKDDRHAVLRGSAEVVLVPLEALVRQLSPHAN